MFSLNKKFLKKESYKMSVFKNPIYQKRIILIIPSLVGGGTERNCF